MESQVVRVLVTGHRNPDIDSIASAVALAELRRRQNGGEIRAVCPGIMPERAKYLFEKFHFTAPSSVNDIYLKVSDVMTCDIPVIPAGTPLFDAVQFLKESMLSRLPVTDAQGHFLGMLSPMNLLGHLLGIGGTDAESDLTGRRIHTSIDLIARVIEAENLTAFETDVLQDFTVFVGAMGGDSFEKHIAKAPGRELVVISGDRPEIHLRSLQKGVRLLIVTGEKSVEPMIRTEAENRHVTILRTALDSASVIRRLKFSVPVEYFGFGDSSLTLAADDRLRGLERKVLNRPEDVIPVLDGAGKFVGAVFKRSVTATPPYRVILVDHNEIEQSLPGVEDIPVIEVVDHHRIGMQPTAYPIKFTGDIVGSTCTLVASMFKSSGESLTAELAGLLLGGIVSDTLNLKSPTTAPLDFRMRDWLEKLSGVKGDDLMAELARIDSPLASKSPAEAIDSDRKNYTEGSFKFAVSQLEETNLELLHQREEELSEAMTQILTREKLSFLGLLVTDAVRENSELLILGDERVIGNLPYRRIEGNRFSLPGVMSRKKQLLPQIVGVLAQLEEH
ncbi:MAG: putative manganese-dependent inorganic diphosphatase [Victivallaceae bacterium]|nr:putative manganese-dependent inorganic diphosphatase [Victivallaceae bacterium]